MYCFVHNHTASMYANMSFNYLTCARGRGRSQLRVYSFCARAVTGGIPQIVRVSVCGFTCRCSWKRIGRICAIFHRREPDKPVTRKMKSCVTDCARARKIESRSLSLSVFLSVSHFLSVSVSSCGTDSSARGSRSERAQRHES